MPTVSPIIATSDLPRLESFYTGLLEATVAERYPDDGPAFFLGLRIGDSHLGLVADDAVSPGTPGRVLLSIDVPDVDALLPRIAGLGGDAGSGANDMPWGQRVAHVADPDGNALNLTQQL
ncbi:VOC family protein [Blastococcus sp. CCUG 61487]|uniref:VOC family protein n=1 Tax=Blastococcus sp. CCUG 61487 TaxID=1840703 RepID=UPI00113B7FB4|nr:VOC family protein [Blastococcus sp. CCUG 61487]TKJ33121.1 extradiol dioxygenase [Blastococcus sp. CCUG 61487]